MSDAASPAAWYPDPGRTHEHRYFDGATWTAHVADRGQASEAPIRPIPPGELARIAVRGTSIFIATFVASWWLIGDLTEPGIRRYNLDYDIRPPDLPTAAVVAGGVVSLAVGVTIVVWSIVAFTRGRSRLELPIIFSLIAAGFVLAGIGRMETAGTVGANIGGGIAVMLGAPIMVILLVYALRQFGKIRSLQALGRLHN